MNTTILKKDYIIQNRYFTRVRQECWDDYFGLVKIGDEEITLRHDYNRFVSKESAVSALESITKMRGDKFRIIERMTTETVVESFEY